MKKKRIIINFGGKPHLLVGVKAILREVDERGKSKAGKPVWVAVEVEPFIKFLDGGKKKRREGKN